MQLAIKEQDRVCKLCLSCVLCMKKEVLMFSCPSHIFLYFRLEIVLFLHSPLIRTETCPPQWVRVMVNGCLLQKGVREEEEDNVVIPLCKETKCLKI